MATYNFMNEQVTTDASGTPTTVAPITSSTTNTSGALSNVQTGQAKPITMAQMYPAQPITVPTAPATPNPAEATAASAAQTTKTLDQYIKELTPTPTATSQQYESLLGELNNLLPGLTGRGSDQLAAETQAGLPDLKQKLAGLNAQILSKVAELTKSNASYEQLIANLENPANAQQQGIPMSAIIGQQAQARKAQLAEANSKSADLGLLQAVASGMQGNIQAMQQGIDRAIDLKYQDRESTVNLKMQQLQLLEGKLNKEEAIQKAALERKYNEEREKLAEEKAKAKANVALAIESGITTQYVNRNGEFFRASDGKPYGSPEEFFKDAGVKSFEEAYQKGLVGDFNPQASQEREIVANIIAKYPDAGISLRDTLASAKSKLGSSRIYGEQVRPPAGAGGGGTGVLGLSNQQIDNISPLVTQFQNSSIVKNYNTLGETLNFVNSLSNTSKNPTDDQALIYSIAKALDPDSVVREGEYSTVQKYSQSWAKAYGKSVNQAFLGTGFLSETARQNIKATLQARYNATKISYDNLYNETTRRVNLIGGTDKGGMLLNNYGGAFAPTSTNSMVGPQAPIQQTIQQPTQNFWQKATNWLFGD